MIKLKNNLKTVSKRNSLGSLHKNETVIVYAKKTCQPSSPNDFYSHFGKWNLGFLSAIFDYYYRTPFSTRLSFSFDHRSPPL